MRSSSILQADDMEIGGCVTVLRGKRRKLFDVDGNNNISHRTEEDKSYKGSLLEIIAIDLPYIIVDRYHQPGYPPERIAIDVREVTLKILSQKYIDAFFEGKKHS